MKITVLPEKRILTVIVFMAAIVFGVTAFNSHGFFHGDEHFQIVEFAGLKLGTHAPHELVWEFDEKIRPTLQPSICFVLLSLFDTIGIADPYTQMFLLRLMTALFAVFVITRLIKATEGHIEDRLKIPYYLLSFFLWFIPFISVRFSSETLSALFFVLALTLVLKKLDKPSAYFKVGLLLGVSFLFRFQIAFAIVGLGLWLLLINRSKLKDILLLTLAFLIVVMLGTAIDCWFYSELVFTPWNYIKVNIIEGVAATFSTSPWHYYMEKLVTYPSAFIGIPLALSIVLVLIAKPKSVVLWCIVFFTVGHSIFSHKEERFLFPLVYLFPLVLIEGYTIVRRLISVPLLTKTLGIVVGVVFIAVNATGLVAMSRKSAGLGRLEITRHIHQTYGDKPINLIFCKWANPYNPWGTPMKFYEEKNIVYREIGNMCELNDSLLNPRSINLFALRKIDLDRKECQEIISRYKLELDRRSSPHWIERLNSKQVWFENENVFELYSINYSN